MRSANSTTRNGTANPAMPGSYNRVMPIEPLPQRVFVVRHAEVDNPERIVYGDLPGFGLSPRGRVQAAATAAHLAEESIAAVCSSPLQRAVETAEVIAARHQIPATTDERLTEWALGSRWAGVAWDALPDVYPGEVEAYLTRPQHLPFPTETLSELAHRTAAAIAAAAKTAQVLAIVSHQDPIQAARLAMTGRGFDDFAENKPGHGAVIQLRPQNSGWIEVEYWEPEQGDPFPPSDS